ncbi:MAG: hypothetical protein RLZZ362_1731, partial [Actinomycetota bacterium]
VGGASGWWFCDHGVHGVAFAVGCDVFAGYGDVVHGDRVDEWDVVHVHGDRNERRWSGRCISRR